ncbi:MAG: cation:proton antiporter [Planctomycetales bacterium]|nr:cation:proton antiporter [Planctomycetales bacterium]
MPTASPIELHSAVSLGILLLASLIGGIAADVVRIPKVTAYLLAGMVVGPSVAHAISGEHIHHFEPFTKLAMALVLLELGCRFPLAHLRPILKRALWLSGGEMLCTFLCVACLVWLYSHSLSAGVLLGALALATAPATTVLVFKESRSEGPVTELAGVLVALNNIVAIVAFELLFLASRMLSDETAVALWPQLVRLAEDLGGACLLGIAGGLLISYFSGLLNRRRWLVMVLAVAILMLGLCETWHLPYMLAFLIAGVFLVNTSEAAADLLGEQEKIAGLLVVVFFAVHGAELHLTAFWAAGMLGIVYILGRSTGKILGIHWAAKLRGETIEVRRYLGYCLLSQAGAAIALATLAAQRWPELGEQLQVIILGSVVFFEIVGPICIRWSVLQAGEVPLAQAIAHSTETPSSQAHKMWLRSRDALGLRPSKATDVRSLKVENLLRRNVTGIPQTANFDQVVEHIRRSHDNTYVVVDEEQGVVGIIRYAVLSDTFFDSSHDQLIRAADLTSAPSYVVHPQDPLTVALEEFKHCTDDVLAVVSSDASQRFLGVIRRSELTELAIRYRQ